MTDMLLQTTCPYCAFCYFCWVGVCPEPDAPPFKAQHNSTSVPPGLCGPVSVLIFPTSYPNGKTHGT